MLMSCLDYQPKERQVGDWGGGGGQRLIYVDSVRRGHWSPVNSGA